jgi:hypothetical protein
MQPSRKHTLFRRVKHTIKATSAGRQSLGASKWTMLPETVLDNIRNSAASCFGNTATPDRIRKQLRGYRNRFLFCSFAQTFAPLHLDASSTIPQRSSWNCPIVILCNISTTTSTKLRQQLQVLRDFNLLEFLSPRFVSPSLIVLSPHLLDAIGDRRSELPSGACTHRILSCVVKRGALLKK